MRPTVAPSKYPSNFVRRRSKAVVREVELTAAAKSLERVYTIERRHFEFAITGVPSTYRPSKRWQGGKQTTAECLEDKEKPNIWLQVWKGLKAKHVDPLDFVRIVFGALTDTPSAPPHPPQLLSDSTWATYSEAMRHIREDVTQNFHINRNLVASEINLRKYLYEETTREATLAIIESVDLGLSYLFRYCLARSMKKRAFRLAAERLERSAAIEYVRCRLAFDSTVWKEWLPQDFIGRAYSLYEESA
jgi:hypothetical protein